MDIFATYATDLTKEEEGVVVFLTSGQDLAKDPWIKVARMNNEAYSAAVTKTYDRLTRDKKLLKLSDAEAEIRAKNGMLEVLADTILKSFGNLEFQGDSLPPGRESHLKFLRIKDFREVVMTHALNVDLYREARQEEAAGN
jgi:hypothetical protein